MQRPSIFTEDERRKTKQLRHILDMKTQYYEDVTVPRKHRVTSISIKFNRTVLKFKWKNKDEE